MEIIFGAFIITLNLIAFSYFDQRIRFEHKKTRKDQQEIKTRLTQVRKDLNVIEKLLRKR